VAKGEDTSPLGSDLELAWVVVREIRRHEKDQGAVVDGGGLGEGMIRAGWGSRRMHRGTAS
jgi:hypothetical protein